jgi:hypothetical protein
MKKLLFIAASFIIGTGAIAQTTKTDDVVKFHELKYDFGKIKQGVPATFDFEFKNISDKPLVIESASASCGCTTPKWPQAAIMAGKSDKINVGYNAAGAGTFTKTITVKVAGADAPVMLSITGEVLAADAYDAYVKETELAKAAEAAKAAAEKEKTTKSKGKGKNKSGK